MKSDTYRIFDVFEKKKFIIPIDNIYYKYYIYKKYKMEGDDEKFNH